MHHRHIEHDTSTRATHKLRNVDRVRSPRGATPNVTFLTCESGMAGSVENPVVCTQVRVPEQSGHVAPGSRQRRSCLGTWALCVLRGVLALRAPVAFSKIWADDGPNSSVAPQRESRLDRSSPSTAAICCHPSRSSRHSSSNLRLVVGSRNCHRSHRSHRGDRCLTFLVARWYIPQRTLCALLGLSVSLVPAIRTESINSVANQHFVLVFAAFWLFLAPPRNAARTIVRSVVVLLIGLSSPLMFVLIPLPIARVSDTEGRSFRS